MKDRDCHGVTKGVKVVKPLLKHITSLESPVRVPKSVMTCWDITRKNEDFFHSFHMRFYYYLQNLCMRKNEPDTFVIWRDSDNIHIIETLAGLFLWQDKMREE